MNQEFPLTSIVGKHIRQATLWAESQWLTGNVLYFASDTQDDAEEFPCLRITVLGSQQHGFFARMLVGIGLVGLVILAPRLAITHRTFEACRRYPHAALAVLGIGWWWLLSPGWIGLFLSVAVLLLWMGTVLRSQRMTLPT